MIGRPRPPAQSGTSDSAASPVQAAGFSGSPADDPSGGTRSQSARITLGHASQEGNARVRTVTSAVADDHGCRHRRRIQEDVAKEIEVCAP